MELCAFRHFIFFSICLHCMRFDAYKWYLQIRADVAVDSALVHISLLRLSVNQPQDTYIQHFWINTETMLRNLCLPLATTRCNIEEGVRFVFLVTQPHTTQFIEFIL